MRLGAVILNYRTAYETLSCCNNLLQSSLCSEVVVVDNCSGNLDDSLLSTKSEAMGFTYIRANQNRGYSAGNNLGIQHLLDSGCDQILIANPDVTLLPEDLAKLSGRLQDAPGAFFVGPKVVAIDGTVDRYAQTTRMPNFWETLAGNYPFYKLPVFRQASKYHIAEKDDGKDRRVYTVMGCCVLFKAEHFQKYGLLDETFFMYNEEYAWAAKVYRDTGELPGLYVADAKAVHDHVKVASETSPFTVIHRMRSQLLYMRKILGCNALERDIAIAYFSAAYNYLARRNPAYEDYRQQFEQVRQECLSFEKNEAGRRDARMEIAKERS